MGNLRERFTTFYASAMDHLRYLRARSDLLHGRLRLGSEMDFIETAPLFERYHPENKHLWIKWAHYFSTDYVLILNDLQRSAVKTRLGSTLNTHRQVVMAEMLWEYNSDTERKLWLGDLLRYFGKISESDPARQHIYRLMVGTSSILPKEIKEQLGINSPTRIPENMPTTLFQKELLAQS